MLYSVPYLSKVEDFLVDTVVKTCQTGELVLEKTLVSLEREHVDTDLPFWLVLLDNFLEKREVCVIRSIGSFESITGSTVSKL